MYIWGKIIIKRAEDLIFIFRIIFIIFLILELYFHIFRTLILEKSPSARIYKFFVIAIGTTSVSA